MLTSLNSHKNSEEKFHNNGKKLVKLSVFVTKEQYDFLKKIRSQKVAMSTFIRGLLAMYMDTYTNNQLEFLERKATITITERKILIPKKSPRLKGYGELHRELMKELKQVLTHRKIT